MKNITAVILGTCVSLQAYSAEPPFTANSIADALNNRFNNKTASCDGQPPYFCSGIVLRSNEEPSKNYVPTWKTIIFDRERGSLAFSFIRSDISNAALSIWGYKEHGFGILLKPGNEGNYGTRCIYPTNGYSITSKDNGCGDIEALRASGDADNSNCTKKSISTAAQWADKFTPSTDKICSFNSHDSATFSEALNAQNLVHQKAIDNGWTMVKGWPEDYDKMWNELVINASTGWDGNNPANDSIQAIWYHSDVSSSTYLSGLDGAQKEQTEYYNLTKQWIPIILIDTRSPNRPFTYSDNDQAIPEPT